MVETTTKINSRKEKKKERTQTGKIT